MAIKLFLTIAFCTFCSISFADEVNLLRSLAKASEKYRELSIDCLIEMKVNKSKGWKSEECVKFKKFSVEGLQTFKLEIKEANLAFKKYSKSNNASNRRVKRGLKQLLIIQENMEGIGNISKQIKNESRR